MGLEREKSGSKNWSLYGEKECIWRKRGSCYELI